MIDMPPKILERLKTCTNFPSPPAVAMQVVTLAQDPEIDLGRVSAIVSADPAIAAKIMRIANSAMYARRRHSTNLRQALIVLGLNATLTLALSFTLIGTLRKDATKGFDFNAYWKRAILSATWGKLLATELGRRDAEEVFLAALLQDIGMLALAKIAPDVYSGIAPFHLDHSRVAQHEKSCIETDHRAAGSWLLQHWNMPAAIIRGVQHSHDPSAGGVTDPAQREFVRCVALSGELADAWLTDHSETGIRRAGSQAATHLGITRNRLNELFAIIGEQIPAAESLFDTPMIPADQLQDILDTARETLVVRNLYDIERNRDLERENSKAKKELTQTKAESATDALTGVFNRRAFDEVIEKEFTVAVTSNSPLTLVFVDLDRFKSINDTHGHPGGDIALKAVADLLRTTLRDTDVVARYGGDEFVLLLPGTDADKVEAIAERLIKRTREAQIKAPDGEVISVTLSLGIATHHAGSKFASTKEFLAAADQALYHSKRNGRDQLTRFDKIKAA